MCIFYFDMNLYYRQHFVCPGIQDIAVNSFKIYLRSDKEPKLSVHSLDWSNFSNPVDYFDQNIPHNCQSMQASLLHLFMLHQDAGQKKLRIIDIETKSIVRELNVDFFDFTHFVFHYSFMFTFFDNRTNRLKLYEQIRGCKHTDMQLDNKLEKNCLQVAMADSNSLVLFKSTGDVIFLKPLNPSYF